MIWGLPGDPVAQTPEGGAGLFWCEEWEGGFSPAWLLPSSCGETGFSASSREAASRVSVKGVFLNKRRLDNQGQRKWLGSGRQCSDPWDPWGPLSFREPSTECPTHTPRAQQAGTATPALWHHGDLRQPHAWTRASITPHCKVWGVHEMTSRDPSGARSL